LTGIKEGWEPKRQSGARRTAWPSPVHRKVITDIRGPSGPRTDAMMDHLVQALEML